MKQRSPVLGYNHNVRYAGRLWHVQTEDSGVNNPHVFTHLFHDGTILATKRLDYDPASELSAVQKLMQTQHKAMLRELKAGAFDEKISKFFGEPVTRGRDDETTDPNAQPPIAVEPPRPAPREARDDERTDPNLRSPVAAPPPSVAMPPRPRSITPPPQPKPAPPPAPRPPTTSTTRAPSVGGVGGIGGRRPSSVMTGVGNRPTAEGVVVARPAVIIGGEGNRNVTERRMSSPANPRFTQPSAPAKPEEPQRPSTNENIFGGDLISEKSLDEVILAYLSEDLNEK